MPAPAAFQARFRTDFTALRAACLRPRLGLYGTESKGVLRRRRGFGGGSDAGFVYAASDQGLPARHTIAKRPMNKSELTDSGSPTSGLIRQAIALVRDFAGFAGLNGLWAEALAVLAATFEAFGLLLGVPILSTVTASGSGAGWTHRLLARAVLRRPFLFVLDEATSAIDVPAEHKIIKAMLDLKPRPTIVMIAHRDQSLAFCDRMLRLQNGRAIADELPDELPGEPALTG